MHADGAIVFSNHADRRLYRWTAGEEPRAITPEGAWRYADGVFDRARDRIVCVREEPFDDGREPDDTLVAVDARGRTPPRVIASGHAFYASPCVSPDGTRLAWLTWDHPNMPWDGTDLWIATIAEDGTLGRPEHVAGGKSESIFQPSFSPDGVLYFVSDRTGFWNLQRWRDGSIEAVLPMAADFGLPQWVFGMSMYAFESADRIVAAYHEDGTGRLVTIDTRTGAFATLAIPFDVVYGGVRADAGRAVFLGASTRDPKSIVSVDLATSEVTVLARASQLTIDPRHLSIAEPIRFPTDGGATAYGYFYRPTNADYAAPPGERPPLIVMSHGGPTARVEPELNPSIQFWTSRGFAVLDVNYGGSTGHGRAYRRRLEGRGGEVDVDDCIAGALVLVKRGDADRARLLVRGGSAGGYTTLAALAFREVFRAGASYYGISDLELLDQEAAASNKFESRYNHSLIGPYPERKDLYIARSPIHAVDRIRAPVIFFQGMEDNVVPPSQARGMFEALRAKKIPTAYLELEGEGHGFRKAATIERTIQAELSFYARVLGLSLDEELPPLVIENLPTRG
jgi:dipeptidyl aminopeptidase/acylaminoacyl peptidase